MAGIRRNRPVRPSVWYCVAAGLGLWSTGDFVFASPREALRVLGRLREVTPQGQMFSAGLVRWDGVEAADEVVGRADEALHHAKHGGRDRVHLADAIPTTRDTRILA
ncbi:hypothetical protein OHA72_61960 [Dactylosporangium sp. NBC_01737]|uniref:hypothetical protein n=1 Tax=Dactylosporangium sp. NBC_01737 TaxID=2975959 RepID=UPI002E1292CD|nr:hypothetical protein OHA72_61960 [Dactylosporangium sp. NBC_01737]